MTVQHIASTASATPCTSRRGADAFVIGLLAMLAPCAASALDWRFDVGARASANWLDYRNATAAAGAPVAGGGASSSPAPDTTPGLEAFAAITPNRALRLELSYERMRSQELRWTTEYAALAGLPSSFSARGELQLWMATAHVFPAQLLSAAPLDIEPFLSIGVGHARNELRDIQESFFTSGPDAHVSSARTSKVAYKLGIGVARTFTPSLRADIALQYGLLGEAQSGSSRTGSLIGGEQAVEPYRFDVRGTAIKVGVAYRF